MKTSSNSYIPALGYRWLTRFYDPVVRVTIREADNVRGLLPDFLGLAGFEKVETTNCYSTLLGTLSLYQANKTVAQRSSAVPSESKWTT